MKMLRLHLALVAVLVAGPASLASAGSSCPLVTDPAGDATGDSLSAENRRDLDILAANIKVVRGSFTSVIRIQKLPESPQLVAGSSYYLFVTRAKVEFAIKALYDASGPSFSVQTGSPLDPLSPYKWTAVSGVFDFTHSEVRVTGPLSALAVDAPTASANRLSGIGATTYDLYASDVVYAGSSVDRAGGTASYAFGQRACF